VLKRMLKAIWAIVNRPVEPKSRSGKIAGYFVSTVFALVGLAAVFAALFGVAIVFDFVLLWVPGVSWAFLALIVGMMLFVPLWAWLVSKTKDEEERKTPTGPVMWALSITLLGLGFLAGLHADTLISDADKTKSNINQLCDYLHGDDGRLLVGEAFEYQLERIANPPEKNDEISRLLGKMQKNCMRNGYDG
jgi:hypothetical protein